MGPKCGYDRRTAHMAKRTEKPRLRLTLRALHHVKAGRPDGGLEVALKGGYVRWTVNPNRQATLEQEPGKPQDRIS